MSDKSFYRVIFLLSFVVATSARAELVFEDQNQAQDDDRETTRAVVSTGDKAIVTQNVAQSAAPAAVSVTTTTTASQPQVVVPADANQASDEPEHLSRAEMIRRTRVRQEIKNEDLLQARIEELRLRDEQKRTDQILGEPSSESNSAGLTAENGEMAPAAAPVVAPMQQQAVSPTLNASTAAPAAAAATSVNSQGTSTAQADLSENNDDADKTLVYVSPRVGYASATNLSSLSTSPKFSLGGAIGFMFSDNMSFELGYTYIDQGISSYYGYSYSGIDPSQVFDYKQNVIDAGVKLYLLGKDSKFKPFVGAGVAYAKNFLNYDSQVMQLYGGANNPDYDINSFMGFATVGADLQITKKIAVTSSFTYHGMFSSSTSFASSSVVTNADQQAVGSVLSKSGFYNINVGLNFMF